MVFSQIYYSFHHSAEGYWHALLAIVPMIFAGASLQQGMTFEFWLPHYPWFFSRLLCWDRGGHPSELFSWDFLVDHSFEMMTDSSSRAFWVKGVTLIVTSRQASWSSQVGYETMFTVDLIIPTRWQSIFWDSWSLFQTLPVDWELWQHATLGHISPFIISLQFDVQSHLSFSITTFRVVSFQPGVQSHHIFSVATFRVIPFQPGIQSHRLRHSESSFSARHS